MLIWSFQKLSELNGATGFVDCQRSLAEQLIADGFAQDLKLGANGFKYITKADMISAYGDTQPAPVAAKTTKKTKLFSKAAK